MKRSHGLIFRADEVRAILDGRKTQTRRMVKLPLKDPMFGCEIAGCEINGLLKDGYSIGPIQVGSIIWVREKWGLMRHHDVTDWCRDSIGQLTQFDIQEQWSVEHAENWRLPHESAYWRPSIHMPRWASRINLEVTAVRVDRLQDIGEDDAKAEGVSVQRRAPVDLYSKICVSCGLHRDQHVGQVRVCPGSHGYTFTNWSFAGGFKVLWQSIYANWDANPWVWVYEFRRVKP